jgi:hypothetical protein
MGWYNPNDHSRKVERPPGRVVEAIERTAAAGTDSTHTAVRTRLEPPSVDGSPAQQGTAAGLLTRNGIQVATPACSPPFTRDREAARESRRLQSLREVCSFL